MGSERCFCPCHVHPGVYPPPCGVCGHDTRNGRMVGGYRDGWEPIDPRDEQIACLTAENERLAGQVRALREAP